MTAAPRPTTGTAADAATGPTKPTPQPPTAAADVTAEPVTR